MQGQDKAVPFDPAVGVVGLTGPRARFERAIAGNHRIGLFRQENLHVRVDLANNHLAPLKRNRLVGPLPWPIFTGRRGVTTLIAASRNPPGATTGLGEMLERAEVVARRIDAQMKPFAANGIDAVVAREGTLKSCWWSGVAYNSDARVEHFPGHVVAIVLPSRNRALNVRDGDGFL